MRGWRPGWIAVAALLAGVLPRAGTAETPGRWTTAAPVPEERTEVAVAEVGGLGGTQALLEYDPVSDRWRQRAPLPTARSGIAAAVLDGKLFVFGGESPAGTFTQVEAYDPAGAAWSAWAPMPTPRHGLGAVALGGRIFVLSGGPRPGGSYSAANEVFTP